MSDRAPTIRSAARALVVAKRTGSIPRWLAEVLAHLEHRPHRRPAVHHLGPATAADLQAADQEHLTMKRPYTAEDVERIRQMAAAGCSNAEIAAALGRSPDALHYKRMTMGIYINQAARGARQEPRGASGGART